MSDKWKGEPRNISGGRESRSRDLDYIMGSRFTERTGQQNKCITEAEWREWIYNKNNGLNEKDEVIANTTRRELQNCLTRGVAGIAFGFGLFFSLFVAIAMSAAAGGHSFWILLIPIMMIFYGCHKISFVDNYLKKGVVKDE